MTEEWKDIEGFEGIYQVSNYGRVKSLFLVNGWGKFGRETILSPYDNGNGYLVVNFRKNGKRCPQYVHRLVARAFCRRKSPEDNVVNHIDHNRKNNNSTNLEWCTPRENIMWSAPLMRGKRKIHPEKNPNYYIRFKKDRFRVIITEREYGSFTTLEEARERRDAVLLEMGVKVP